MRDGANRSGSSKREGTRTIGCRPEVSFAHEPPPEAVYWRRRQALRPWRLLLSTLLGAVFVVLMAWTIDVLDEPTGFDRALASVTHPSHLELWEPSAAADPARLASIDFEWVHAELLPAWVISLHHDPYTLGQAREHRRFEALIGEAGKDPNLELLLRELRDRATSGVTSNASEITYLLDGWNGYMGEAELPWYVAYDLVKTARGGRMYTRSYRVHREVTARVSGQPQHVHLLARVDSTNVGELFFGQTDVNEERAMVVTDRIAEFALDRLWPLMNPNADSLLEGMERTFAPALRREAAMHLSSESMAVLAHGAETRRVLKGRLNEIARRKSCGRGIMVENLPWNGLTTRGRSIVSRAAAHNEKRGCSLVTSSDAEFLIDASDALSDDLRLRQALRELTAWLARAVSAHEVRHLADGSKGRPGPSCDGCPPGMSERGRAEVSAYVASMATEGVGYLALFQACGVDVPTHHDSGGALDFVLGVLAPQGCDAGPPQRLYAQAGVMEWVLFKRVEAIVLPADFPPELPLPAVRMAPASPGFEALAGGPLQTRHTTRPAFPMRAML